jgi:hypothetical protein
VKNLSPRQAVDTSSDAATAAAAMLMAQSLALALIEKELLSGDDILEAVEEIVEAQRSTADGIASESTEKVFRILTTAAEEVASN